MAREILFSFELEPGMYVCEDVFDAKGRQIINKGTRLNKEIISKLEFFSISEVPVDTEMDSIADLEDIVHKEETQRQLSLKETDVYKHFVRDYEIALDIVRDTLNNVVRGKEAINSGKVLAAIQKLLANCSNSHQVLDILHNLETSDEPTYHHSLKVAIISRMFGKWLNLSDEDVNHLTIAGVVHDIGKLVIPPAILNKAGKLTPEEYEIVKNHTLKGFAIIKDQHIDFRAKEACVMHHERCDGSGYPFKVTIDRITPFAKILAISDVYDAMTSARAYRKSFCPFEVIQTFEQEGLYKYDSFYILIFLENIVSSYLHNRVLLSDGREGEVIMINKQCLAKPMLMDGDTFIDLSKEPDVKIVEVL